MADKEHVTVEEITELAHRLERFFDRLKPTVAMASQSGHLVDTIVALQNLVHGEMSAREAALPAIHAVAALPVAAASKPAALAAPASHASRVASDDSVLAFIRSHHGAVTFRDIVAAFDATADHIHYRLKRLRAGYLITASGERPHMLYAAANGESPLQQYVQARPAPEPAVATAVAKALTARAPLGSVDEQLVTLLRGATAGMRLSDIRKSLHLSEFAVKGALSRLRDAGTVRMTGVRGGSRYHLLRA